jgi:GTP cyclohydrolase IA
MEQAKGYLKIRGYSESICEYLLDVIGEDTCREGLADTPERMAKMYKQFFIGYNPDLKPCVTTFKNGSDGIFYNSMITDTGNFYSFCEHHFIPFFGQYWFGYIPDKKILGLSKVARVVDYYSGKLQIQERLVKEIVDELEKACQPKGIALMLRARHLCKEMRGVKKVGEMTTSEMRGVFKKNSATRQEFLDIC